MPNYTQTPGTLRAFRADDVSQEIYNSDVRPARDAPSDFTKFAPPVVANGKVYVATQSGELSVYGLQTPSSQDGAARSVVNTADYTPRLAPHSLTSIFGTSLASEICSATETPLPNELCGVSIEVTGEAGTESPAAVLYVSPDQINIQMPATPFTSSSVALSASDSPKDATLDVQVCVRPSNACAAIDVREQTPAIFTYQREPGVLDPVLTHANGVLVSPSDPAAAGETLILYATGFGRPDESFPPDGETAPFDRLFELGDRSVVFLEVADEMSEPDPLNASFVGLAPGFIGVCQINFTLPTELESAASVSIWLRGPLEGRSGSVTVHVE